MAGRLEGKVAIITGAASGQGAAEAKLFVAEGAKVVMTDLSEDAGRALAATLGENALFIKQDVSDEANWQTVVETTLATFGTIDILVNNAGILSLTSLEDTTPELFDRIQKINMRSVFLGMKAVVPTMKAKKAGSIVNISSQAGIMGQINAVAYSASKWGVRGMSKSAALELGVYNIRVNSVHPGMILTPMTASSQMSADDPLPFAAISRPGLPEEVATGVLFLASDDASYVSGTELVIDGGAAAGDTPMIYQMMSMSAE